MGGDLDAREGRFTPLTITGRALHGTEYALPVASAQIKSCVLLAGLLAEGTTTVVEPEPSRDHTERLLQRAGAGIERAGDRISVTCQDELLLDTLHVPGDPSSAAFLVAAAVLVPGSRLVVEGMAANWTRVGFFRIIERMGAVLIGDLEARETAAPDAEPVCELDVAHGPLSGTRVTADEVPLAIDELPLVALLGCFLASREGVEVVGMEAAAVSYPGFTTDLGALTG
jgi:3-phosphoshikimate 1-carboxyvinyltransferase